MEGEETNDSGWSPGFEGNYGNEFEQTRTYTRNATHDFYYWSNEEVVGRDTKITSEPVTETRTVNSYGYGEVAGTITSVGEWTPEYTTQTEGFEQTRPYTQSMSNTYEYYDQTSAFIGNHTKNYSVTSSESRYYEP